MGNLIIGLICIVIWWSGKLTSFGMGRWVYAVLGLLMIGYGAYQIGRKKPG